MKTKLFGLLAGIQHLPRSLMAHSRDDNHQRDVFLRWALRRKRKAAPAKSLDPVAACVSMR